MVARTNNRSRATGIIRALLALTLLVAFAALIVLLTTRYFQVGEVRVPDVVGETAAEATRSLSALGFEVSTFIDETPSDVAGGVTSQAPDAGSLVRQGRGVSLGVSSLASGSVPNLIGLTQDEAAAQLEPLQLGVTNVGYRNAPQAAGVVLSQTPAPGSTVDSPVEVSLVVSRGPQPAQVVLPNFVGRRLAVARQQLEALGFRRIETIPTQLGTPGVNDQFPQAGERVPLSSQVTLYYSVGNPQVVRIPQVTGLSAAEAVRRLNAAGLRVGWLQENPFDPSQSRGVSAVVPRDYTLWGSPVTLTTNGAAGTVQAQDPSPPQTTQSGVTREGPQNVQPGRGMPSGQAEQGQQAGPEPQQLQGQQGQPQAQTGEGVQSPEALPEVGGRQIPIDYDPANYGFLQGRAYEFRVEISDEQGDRVAIDRAMAPDEAVEDSVTVYGEAELRMYIDGQIILAYNPPNP